MVQNEPSDRYLLWEALVLKGLADESSPLKKMLPLVQSFKIHSK